MIEYERLNTENVPNDVKITTDDANAEMAALSEMIAECEFEIDLPDERDENGNFSFTIPGEMVGEFSETVYDIDDGKLERLTDKWNQEMLDALENET